jgi:hypothetical protein
LILYINVVLACMYIGQSKKKCFKFSRVKPHRQNGSDTIPYISKFKNEAELLSWVKIIFNFRGPQKKCLGTEWFSVSSIFFNSDLNFDKVSTYRILIFKLFHIYIVEGIKESLAEDSLQKGKIISFPFLNGYTDVLCMVGWGGGSMYKDN